MRNIGDLREIVMEDIVVVVVVARRGCRWLMANAVAPESGESLGRQTPVTRRLQCIERGKIKGQGRG